MTSTLETQPAPAGAAGAVREVRVAIIGSGFAGLGMAIALRRRGETDFVVLERGDDVGGTWRDNHYPGAACDVQCNLYSFSFAPNPDWPRSYSEQPEIQAYLQATARPVRRPPALRVRRRRHRGAMGRRRPPLAGDDDGRRVPRAGARLGRRRPGRPDLSRHPGPGLLRRHGRCTPPAGTTPTTSPASGSPSSAPAPRRSRSCRPSSRSSAASRSTSAPPPWVVPRTDHPVKPRDAAGSTGASRRCRGPSAPCSTCSASSSSSAWPSAGASSGRWRSWPARTCTGRSATRKLRAALTPDYTIGCKRILISNDYYPAVAAPNAELVTAGIAEIRPTRSSTGTASSGPPTRSCWPPAST